MVNAKQNMVLYTLEYITYDEIDRMFSEEDSPSVLTKMAMLVNGFQSCKD